MDNVTDFRRKQLDRDKIPYVEANGELWLPYCFEYEAFGKLFGITLYARNLQEANSLCFEMKNSIRLMGEVIEDKI